MVGILLTLLAVLIVICLAFYGYERDHDQELPFIDKIPKKKKS